MMNAQAAPSSPSPPRRGHGCLWGCLVVLVILSLPGLFAGWFFWRGYTHDPVLRTAAELVRHDGMARRVLGENIHITGVESRGFAYGLGLSSENDYRIDLEGTRGRGVLDVRSRTGRGGFRIESLWLTGPGGRRYDLLHHGAPLPAPGTIENSI
jgi:hypothetical protein